MMKSKPLKISQKSTFPRNAEKPPSPRRRLRAEDQDIGFDGMTVWQHLRAMGWWPPRTCREEVGVA